MSRTPTHAHLWCYVATTPDGRRWATTPVDNLASAMRDRDNLLERIEDAKDRRYATVTLHVVVPMPV